MALFNKTRALIFKAVPYREYDKRVDLLTRDYGKITVVAPAAQRSRKRFSSALDTLTHISAHYREKHGYGMPALLEMTALDVFYLLKKDIKKISYASYFLEIVWQVMREPSPPLFDFLFFFLKALEKTNREDWLARFFEARILPKIGYLPRLRQCVKCNVPKEALSGEILFSVSSGGILCAACARTTGEKGGRPPQGRISSQAILFLDRMISQAKMFPLNEKISTELKGLLPSFLFHHLEKEPKSYRFIEALDVLQTTK
jgi:DNA repair protein RecO (recombination protein O)